MYFCNNFFHFSINGLYEVFVILFALIAIFWTIYNKKDKSGILIPFFIALLFCFIASYLGYYPIIDRLVQGFSIFFLILAAIGSNEFGKNFESDEIEIISVAWGVVLAGCLGIVLLSGINNFFSEHVIRRMGEISESLDCLQENVQEDDMIYVFSYAIPMYIYETNYITPISNYVSEPYVSGNTIYGQILADYPFEVPYSYEYEESEERISEDAEAIMKYDTVYILCAHNDEGMSGLLQELMKQGDVKMLKHYYNSFVYKFTKE